MFSTALMALFLSLTGMKHQSLITLNLTPSIDTKNNTGKYYKYYDNKTTSTLKPFLFREVIKEVNATFLLNFLVTMVMYLPLWYTGSRIKCYFNHFIEGSLQVKQLKVQKI